MSEIHILAVGKLKDQRIAELEQDYLKRIKNLKIKIHELRAHGENLQKEAEEVFKKLSSLEISSPILLTENGKSFDSPKFSEWVYQKLQNGKMALVIGGAAGFESELKGKAQGEISLGKMTYPHRLARLLLIEQLYRAECIHLKHPYHK